MSTDTASSQNADATLSVLHVDDKPDFAELTATFLEREDERFAVETAPSADEALDRLADRQFDCVVSDYDMPGRNGIELLEAVRDTHPDLPFVLFTGKGSEEIASDAVSAGVSDYLQKRSGTEQYSILANRISNLIAQNRAQARLETRARQQRVVAELGQDALAGEPQQSLFETAVRTVADVLDNEYAKVLRYRPERDDLRLQAGVGWRDGLVGAATVGTGEDSQAGYTLRSERPVVVEDLRTDDRFCGPPLLTDHDVVSGISVAIGSPAEPWGVLGTHTTDRTAFTEDDSNFVQSVAHVLSSAIERTEHERELRRKERRYQAVFNDPNILVGLLDTDGSVLDINRTAMDYIDASCEAVRNVPFWETPWFSSSASLQARVREWIDRAAGGEYVDFEADLVGAEGETYTIEGVFRPVRDDDGEVVSILVSDRDVTDRKEHERELEQRTEELAALTDRLEEQYRYLFEEAPVMAALTRAEDGRPIVEDCNQLFTETLGYDTDEVIGRELAAFYTAESTRTLLEEGGYDRALRGDFVREDRTLVAADGERVETLLRAVPRYDARDEVTGTLAFYIDVSERRELEREKKRLEEFTSVVSHDLRNPLNVAQSYTKLARAECESTHLDAVIRAHDRMEALVEDLLTLARSGEHIDETDPIDLANVAESCWENVETAEATLLTDTDRTVRADRSRLQQLFENLIRNAVEHGSAQSPSRETETPGDDGDHGGADVRVRVGDLDDGFYVEDDGPGIPESDRQSVFEAGYSTASDGTGFGLSIVKQVAEAHDWEIRATAGADGGARFEIAGVEFVETDGDG